MLPAFQHDQLAPLVGQFSLDTRTSENRLNIKKRKTKTKNQTN